MKIEEAALTDALLAELVALSADWEAEGSCWGYRKNTAEDIVGNRVFLASENGETVGYLFGHGTKSDKMRSVMPPGTDVFEIDELYVRPAYRSRGVGAALFRYAEAAVGGEADYLFLSTATKNCRAILHFYLDEVGMEFWSASLFKKLR